MSEYRRFFSYIYAYEQNQKTSNAGFAKIEMKGDMTTIELHMRGAVILTPTASLYLFVRKGDAIIGFLLGNVPFSAGNADRRFTLNQPQLAESSYTFSDASGILLLSEDNICFVSQWDEAPINWENFRVYEPEDTTAPEPKDSLLEDKVIQSTELPLTQRRMPIFSVINNPSHAKPAAEDLSDQPLPERISSNSPQTDSPSIYNVRPASHSSWKETWQHLIATLPLIHPFSNEEICCVRVELKDLRLLPPSNWHLCNNSFLLHGFFTYRHLIIGELPSAKEHKWFIGVPGIRYRQEHVLAAIFGFSDFLPDKESADADAPFGYWYVSMTEAD